MTEAGEESGTKENHEDKLSQAIGEFGRWQMFQFCIIAVPLLVALPMVNFGIIFMAPKITYRCLERVNATGEFEHMTCYSDCTKYEYTSDFESSIIEQWDLICDRAWLADFTQSVCMFGVLVGGIILGSVSDRYGRRLSLFINGSLECCMCLVMPFCANFWIFIAVRFVLGLATGGTTTTSFVLLVEIVGPKKKNLLGSIFMMPCTLGRCIVAIVTFYFRSWKEFTVGLATPMLICLTYMFILPESPKWLISVGKLDEAVIVMTSAAKWNKLPTNDIKKIAEDMTKDTTSNNANKTKVKVIDLVTSPSLRITNLCCCIIWFIGGVSYFGPNQYFGQTTSNVFLVFALIGILQAPSFILGAYLSDVVGRKIALMILFSIGSVGNGILILNDEWYYSKLVAGIVGVSFLGSVYPIMCVYTAEMFPTGARNTAMGVFATIQKVGTMLAPFIAGLRTEPAWLPPAIFAVAPVVAVVVSFCLPENKGKK